MRELQEVAEVDLPEKLLEDQSWSGSITEDIIKVVELSEMEKWMKQISNVSRSIQFNKKQTKSWLKTKQLWTWKRPKEETNWKNFEQETLLPKKMEKEDLVHELRQMNIQRRAVAGVEGRTVETPKKKARRQGGLVTAFACG